MRIALISDLHFDNSSWSAKLNQILFSNLKEQQEQMRSNVCIVAGDVCQAINLLSYLEQICKIFPQVIYIAGNHEYYRNSFGQADQIIEKIIVKLQAKYAIYWLENEMLPLFGVNFIGTTLWFSHIEEDRNIKNFNDFKYIRTFADEFNDRHKKAVGFLWNNIHKRDIVITHHAPSYQSVHPSYIGDYKNKFFCSNLDDLIVETQPAFWFHGHMHTSYAGKLGETAIIRNPRGYNFINEGLDVRYFASIIDI